MAYVGLLESSLFEAPVPATTETGKIDFNAILTGSKKLRLDKDTAWKWQLVDNGKEPVMREVCCLSKGIEWHRIG